MKKENMYEKRENIENYTEIMTFINIDKYVNAMIRIENQIDPSEKTLETYLKSEDTLMAFIENLDAFGVNNKSSKEISEWFIKCENYIAGLSDAEYRLLLKSRKTNADTEKFSISNNSSKNDIVSYPQELLSEKHRWLKSYLDKNFSIVESDYMKKIKEM